MSIESAIEGIIKAAMARGEFDNLEGAGKPVISAHISTRQKMSEWATQF